MHFYFRRTHETQMCCKLSFANCFQSIRDFHVILFPAHFFCFFFSFLPLALSLSLDTLHKRGLKFDCYLYDGNLNWTNFIWSLTQLLDRVWCHIQFTIKDKLCMASNGQAWTSVSNLKPPQKNEHKFHRNSPKREHIHARPQCICICISNLKHRNRILFAANSLTINYIDERNWIVGPCNRIPCASNNVNENLSMLFLWLNHHKNGVWPTNMAHASLDKYLLMRKRCRSSNCFCVFVDGNKVNNIEACHHRTHIPPILWIFARDLIVCF